VLSATFIVRESYALERGEARAGMAIIVIVSKGKLGYWRSKVDERYLNAGVGLWEGLNTERGGAGK
jgi:hypothetical protein